MSQFERKRLIVAAVVAGWCVLPAPGVHATKPCPPAPCQDPSGKFDRPSCEALADWVAEGIITKVVHHREGPPLAKDFAEFTFRVHRWEKKASGAGAEVRFKVGWCVNEQELPADTSGIFRFFGKTTASPPAGGSVYLHFERVVITDAR
jgi:hypothetical protein